MLKLFDIEQMVSINSISATQCDDACISNWLLTMTHRWTSHWAVQAKYILKVSCFGYKWTENRAGTQFVCFYFTLRWLFAQEFQAQAIVWFQSANTNQRENGCFTALLHHSEVVCLPSPHCLWARFVPHKFVSKRFSMATRWLLRRCIEQLNS